MAKIIEIFAPNTSSAGFQTIDTRRNRRECVVLNEMRLMKPNYFKSLAALMTAGCMTLSASVALAQDSSASQTAPAQPAQPAPDVAPAPPLPYGVSQILQLQQAKVGDDTIIAYIRNSRNSYGLNADQIIYLRQQGVSSAVINTMLSQPAPGVLAAAPTPTQPASAAPATYDSQPASPTSIVGPSVTAIDPTATAAATTYYYQPYYYPNYYYPCYYPAYGFYPGVSLSVGWGGRWGGGWGGGWHGGGGFHGGWHR